MKYRSFVFKNDRCIGWIAHNGIFDLMKRYPLEEGYSWFSDEYFSGE